MTPRDTPHVRERSRGWVGLGLRLAPGFAILVTALLAPALRRASDGSLLPLGWTAAVAGIAVALLGTVLGTRWQRCGALAALALVGQASALALIDAPNYGVLQHFAPWAELLSTPRGLLLMAPVAQTAVVATILGRRRAAFRTWFGRLFSLPQALGLAALIVLASANGSFDIARYAGELALAVWLVLVNGLNLILVAAAVPSDALEAAANRVRERFSAAAGTVRTFDWDRAYPWAVASGVAIASAAISVLVLERIPHIPDSVSHLFQAKYFSTGRLHLPAPPDADAFEFLKLYTDGTKWWAYTFPGWPAVLALGVLVGLPWLVNPLAGGLAVLLTHRLVERLYDRRFAHAVVTLLAVSPWYLFMSATFLPHPVSAVWLLAALLAVEKAREATPVWWGALAGVCLGALFLTRPLDGLLASPVVGLWALGLGGRRLPARGLTAAAVGGAMIGLLLFPYNRALTGDPFQTPHSLSAGAQWYSGGDRLGFGPDVGNLGWVHLDPLPGHGPLDIILNAHQNLFSTNFELFGWSFGSLAFVALLLLWRRVTRSDLIFLGLIVAIAGGYGIYWFSGGPDFGARYWYLTLVPLVVLTVRGVQETRRRWKEEGGTAVGSHRVVALVVVASLTAIITVIPWRSVGKYHDYRDMTPDVGKLAKACEFGRSLVFVRGDDISDYPSALIFNAPTLASDGTIYARDLGPEARRRVMSHFPDRPIWILAVDPSPAGRFIVVEGPRASSERCRRSNGEGAP